MGAPPRCFAALASACALLAACTSAPQAVPLPMAAEFRPAQRSALVTQRELTFLVATWQGGGESTTVLARQQAGAAPRPVARLLQVRQGPVLQVSVQQLPQPWASPERVDDEIATLEQLYSVVLRLEPQARYCLGRGRWPCDAGRNGLSHAQVLQALAEQRERAIVRLPAAVPWRVVEMQGAPPRTWDADVVGVRATGPQGPLKDVPVYFNRAPHSICSARTGADGVASCRLQDQHADGHQHDHATAVVVTFPGELRPDRVLLPTTHVLSGGPGVAPAAFARPLAFPPVRP